MLRADVFGPSRDVEAKGKTTGAVPSNGSTASDLDLPDRFKPRLFTCSLVHFGQNDPCEALAPDICGL